MSFTLACDLPVPKKYCPDCGWSWTGEPEEVVEKKEDKNGKAD